jgi:hypothetical protein
VGFWRKVFRVRILKRIFYERLTEPLHLNVLALWVAVFGSFRLRVAFDLVLRHHNAYGLLRAADEARALGVRRISAIEFGVAAGAGLLNMCQIARRVTKLTGVEIIVYGFDTGQGMPPAQDYRDHPDLYQQGDFPMDFERLRAHLPENGRLLIGDLSQTLPAFMAQQLSADAPLGYVVVDVDYYSSTVIALSVFDAAPELYLPIVTIYADDVELPENNPYAGEQLAFHEYNARNPLRKICRHEFFEDWRIFQRAIWLKHMYFMHVMDHPRRRQAQAGVEQRVLGNPLL